LFVQQHDMDSVSKYTKVLTRCVEGGDFCRLHYFFLVAAGAALGPHQASICMMRESPKGTQRQLDDAKKSTEHRLVAIHTRWHAHGTIMHHHPWCSSLQATPAHP